MPAIGGFHPQIVHFAIALLVTGVILRWVSLTGRAAFAGPAAATLLLAGTLSAVAAVKSGLDAHGPVERVPGTAEAVREHEEWGERTRTVFLLVALAEILALPLSRWEKVRFVRWASGVLGVVGLFCLYEAGEHGGELVYSYAGGVGIRGGDADDVGRLLLAGLYHQAEADRKAGKAEDAAALVELAARRFPNDVGVRLLAAESLLVDRKDAAAALAALGRITVLSEDRRNRFRHAWLTADALMTQGQNDAARATLQALRSEFPDNERLRKRIESLGTSPVPTPAAVAAPSPSPAAAETSPSPG